MMKFRCPHCGQKLGVPDEYANRRIRCSKCSQPSCVPAVTASPPASQKTPQTMQSVSASQTEKQMNAEEFFAQTKQDSPVVELQTPPNEAPPEGQFAGLEDLEIIEDSPDRQALRQARQLQRQKAQRQSPSGGSKKKARKDKTDDTSGGGFSLSGMFDFIPDVLRLPIGLAVSIVAVGLMIGIWIAASRATENALGFMCLLVPLAGAAGLRLFAVDKTLLLALLGTLIGGLGIAAGKFAIARYVVIPYCHEQVNKEVLVDLPALLIDEKYQLRPGESAKFVSQDGDLMQCIALISLVDEEQADPIVARKWIKHILLASNKTNIYAYLISQLGSGPESPPLPEMGEEDESMFELASEQLAKWFEEEVELRMARQYFAGLNCICGQANLQRLLEKPETAMKFAIMDTLGLFDALWILLGMGLAYLTLALD